MKYTFLAFVMICTVTFTGCKSKNSGAGAAPDDALSTNVIEPIATAFAAGLSPAFELGYVANEYRVAKHRWPKDYNELSNFLEQTGDKTYSSFPAVTYHRVGFAETTDGKLKIDADYTVNPTGKFGPSGTVHINGTNKIDFVVSPFDSRKMRLTNGTTEATSTAR